MAKKPKTHSKVTGKHLNELVEALSNDIDSSIAVTFNDRRFFVQSTVNQFDQDESTQLICQLKGGKLQFLQENAFIAQDDPSVAWKDLFDLELQGLKEFILDGVIGVLNERGVIT